MVSFCAGSFLIALIITVLVLFALKRKGQTSLWTVRQEGWEKDID